MEDEKHVQPSKEGADGESLTALTGHLGPESPPLDVEDAATTPTGESSSRARGGSAAVQVLPFILVLFAARLRDMPIAIWHRLRRSVRVVADGDALGLRT